MYSVHPACSGAVTLRPCAYLTKLITYIHCWGGGGEGLQSTQHWKSKIQCIMKRGGSHRQAQGCLLLDVWSRLWIMNHNHHWLPGGPRWIGGKAAHLSQKCPRAFLTVWGDSLVSVSAACPLGLCAPRWFQVKIRADCAKKLDSCKWTGVTSHLSQS